MKIHDLLKESRPREKLQKVGVENLSTEELLALIMMSGSVSGKDKTGEMIPSENAIEMSTRLIKEKGLDKLSECSLKELQEIRGIGIAKACQIKALFEFNKRHCQAKRPIKKIKSAEDVFNYFKDRFKDEKQECFYVLLLDIRKNIINEKLITRGVLDASIIHPREVFKLAIKDSASKIILIHNHPSGDPNPSREDVTTTEEIVTLGRKMGIDVLDHVIIGNNRYWRWSSK